MSNILFIAPVFNDYERIIKQTLSQSGANKVKFIHDCPFKSIAIWAFLTRIFPFIKQQLIIKHNKKIVKVALKNDIDKVFIIKGEYVSPETLSIIKTKSEVELVIYQWDSIKNNPNAISLIDISDRFYTFDPIDAKKYDMLYLPLFYCWDEVGFRRVPSKIRYDFFSLGGFKTNRIPYLKALRQYCTKHNKTFYFRNYERFGSYLKNRKKLKIRFADVSFIRVSYKSYYRLLSESSCIVDIPSTAQTGLTMRTMETLSLGKKLVTTNHFIRNERFFNNTFVIDKPEDLDTPEFLEFLATPVVKCEGLYSLTAWLKEMKII